MAGWNKVFSNSLVNKLTNDTNSYIFRQETLNQYSKNIYNSCSDDNKMRLIGHYYFTNKNIKGDNYNGSFSFEGLKKINSSNKFYGGSINDAVISFFVKLSSLDKTNLRYYLMYGDNDIMCEIARILTLASINKFSNVPYFSIFDAINNDGVNDDVNFSALINSLTNNNFSFEKEFDSFIGDGSCQFLFMKIDEFNYKLIEDFIIDDVLLYEIIDDIKKYYIRKVLSSDIAYENKKFLCNIFNSIITKYDMGEKIIIKKNQYRDVAV